MPELPEVETARRGVAPWVTGRIIDRVVVRVPRLRWEIPPDLDRRLKGQAVLGLSRRGKYLLLECPDGWIILHLGMTGHLRVLQRALPPGRHDRIDILFTDGTILRFNDSRRFGALLWTPSDPHKHPLLVELGPEPFAAEMDGDYLYRRSRGRRLAAKSFIMDHRVVVGVGNIYANEALHRAGIHPARAAGRISRERYEQLAFAIREVLEEAVDAGGTTLRDFVDGAGRPGYFRFKLQVYDREGEPCRKCAEAIVRTRIGGRSSYFCRKCQR